MVTATVHLSEEDYKIVKDMAAFEEMNVSEFMRKTILEQLEDKLDYKTAIDILNEHNGRVARECVLKEVYSD